jgi:hypothetical protein
LPAFFGIDCRRVPTNGQFAALAAEFHCDSAGIFC